MIYKFKFYGHYFALDTKSRAVHNLTEIQYDMLTYLRFPLEEVFPTTLRYDLAKYPSTDLKEAYFAFKKLYEDGVLLSETPLTLPSEENAPKNAEKTVSYDTRKFVFATEVIRAADSGISVLSAVEDESAGRRRDGRDSLNGERLRAGRLEPARPREDERTVRRLVLDRIPLPPNALERGLALRAAAEHERIRHRARIVNRPMVRGVRK